MDAQLEFDIVEILDRHPDITRKTFMRACKKIALFKWSDRRTNLNAYQKFVRTTMPDIKVKYPTMSQHDRMKKIGELWKTHQLEEAFSKL